jgi:hypothetical protein
LCYTYCTTFGNIKRDAVTPPARLLPSTQKRRG